MADDLTIRFGGDTSGLKTALDQARGQVTAFGQSTAPAKANLDAMSGAFKANTTASTQASVSWRDNIATLANLIAIARGAFDAFESFADVQARAAATIAHAEWDIQKASFQADADAARGLVEAMKGIPAAARDAVNSTKAETDALLDFFTSAGYAERGARLYAQANDGIRASIGRTITDARAYIAYLTLAQTSTAKTELAAIAAAGGLDRFNTALTNMGYGAKETLDTFTARLEQIPGTSNEAAASIETMLATIPNYSTQSNDILVNLIQSISKTGDEAVANAKKITAAFSDTANGGKILGDLTGDLRNLDDIQILATRISASLQPAQASAYFDTIIAKLKAQSTLQQSTVDQNVASLQKMPLVGNLMVRTIQDQIDKQKDFAASVTVATANLQLQKKALDDIVAAQGREDSFQKLINDDTTRASQLQEAQGNMGTLKGRLPNDRAPAPDTSAVTGATFDNYLANLNNAIGAKINRALMAGGISGDESLNRATAARSVGPNTPMSSAPVNEQDLIVRTLIGEAGGEGQAGMEAVMNVIKNRVQSGYGGSSSYTDTIMAPKQFSMWNPGAGNPGGAKSVLPDSAIYQKALSIVEDAQSGDLSDTTSGATSYYNAKLATPSWGARMSNQTTIGSHVFGNTPNSPPVATDPDAVENINQRLQEQADKIRQINVAKAGGTAADQAALTTAQQNASATQDAVADARALLAAKKTDLTATEGGSPTAVLAAQRAVAEAEQALREKSISAEKSAADLKAAAFREGSQQKMQILNAELTTEQAQYAQGSAKWNDLQRQKITNTRQYEDAERQSAVDTENAKFDAAQRGFREQQELIKASVDLYGVSKEREYAQLAASIGKEAAAEKAHYAALQQLYADDPKQYAKYQMQMMEVDARTHQQQLQNTTAYQQQLVQTYRSSFEEIGQTISSTLMQMMQGQARVSDLMKNVALNIVQQFVQARIKMVADWGAGQLAQVAATVSGETAKTGATAAGTAARTELVGLASIEQAALVGVGVIKSIIASSAETFAGVFGFLSPIMGPAAAGPAVASQATVAAAATIASFDVGSWALPGNMTANVHAGEMIVPAAATPWAQSLMAAAAGGGSPGGSSSMGDVHFHVNGARDPKAVVDEIRANWRGISRMLATTPANPR